MGGELKRKRRSDENEHVRRLFLQTRAILGLYEIGVGAITCYALTDVLFGLNQGHSWHDVLVGAGMMAFGIALYVVCKGIFRFVAENY